MNKRIIKVLYKEPFEEAVILEIEDDLKTFQGLVEGRIQAVCPFEDKVYLVCNEEGKILGLDPNIPLIDENGIPYDIIVGPFFLCCVNDEGEFISLSEAQLMKYHEMLNGE